MKVDDRLDRREDPASLLSLAHERGCEAELAQILDAELDAGRLSDLPAFSRPKRGDVDDEAVFDVALHHAVVGFPG